jgi:hypothetical protein
MGVQGNEIVKRLQCITTFRDGMATVEGGVALGLFG